MSMLLIDKPENRERVLRAVRDYNAKRRAFVGTDKTPYHDVIPLLDAEPEPESSNTMLVDNSGPEPQAERELFDGVSEDRKE